MWYRSGDPIALDIVSAADGSMRKRYESHAATCCMFCCWIAMIAMKRGSSNSRIGEEFSKDEYGKGDAPADYASG